jgi:hypothetical protein
VNSLTGELIICFLIELKNLFLKEEQKIPLDRHAYYLTWGKVIIVTIRSQYILFIKRKRIQMKETRKEFL